MKRIITTTALLAILAAGALVTAPSALASATCTIHNTPINGFVVSQNQVNWAWDFKCGAAVNANYQLVMKLQYRPNVSGVGWSTENCVDSICQTTKPANGSGDCHSGDYFCAGVEHAANGTFTVLDSYFCTGGDYRIHATVNFDNGDPSIGFNGPINTCP